MQSHSFTWNSRTLLRDGKPWIPFMGEFHYSRYPRDEWRTELYKMKACGVNIVSTYAFWLHHEKTENVFDFSGRRDAGEFLRLCAECGVYAWLRIGPWCHGEARNGGFPDWLVEKGIPLRCNNAEYLKYVRRYWEALYKNVKGALYKNGGSIIGIQIENEFGHCGGDGDPMHMEALLSLAKEIGFDASYYTATGWGGAVIGSMLPVMSCYCDAPWDRRFSALPPNQNYVFSHERNDVDVGSDFERGAHLTFNADDYPYLMAEMGGNIFVTFHRRPVATSLDTSAMSLVKLGSGANMLGYYMYHGGTNPDADVNETRESGSYCETPTLTYFPHSPIGEYGAIDASAKELKRLAMFVESFSETLAPLPCVLPDDGAKRPTDIDSPRYAWRRENGSGFLFVCNHQRGLTLAARAFNAPEYGDIRLESGEYGIYPFNIRMGACVLKRANATPLCILNGSTYVFWTDREPRYELDGSTDGIDIITLTGRQAMDAWLVKSDGVDRLCICENPVIEDENGIFVEARSDCRVSVVPDGRRIDISVPKGETRVECVRSNVNYQCYEYELSFTYADEPFNAFLRVDYEGSIAELYVDGAKAADDTFDGSVWEIGLRRFGFPKRAVLRIYALFEGMPVWLEKPPTFVDGRALSLRGLRVENSYQFRLDI